jgi:hypothetical protein
MLTDPGRQGVVVGEDEPRSLAGFAKVALR